MDQQNDNQKENLLSKIGINMSSDKISIDTTKTKEFFGNIQESIKNAAKNIEESTKDDSIDFPQNAGVKIEDEHIELDLHRTKHFIEEIGKKIEHFIAGLEHSVEELSKK
ncbi:MAG: hypothetical protein IE880_04255 [Epsilonproteobacteria bacterium]|nr:hypothetical protein [Campylobacterota bacterium]